MTGAGRGVFEARETDLAGRTGRIETNHGAVETPAYVPVVHPVRQSVPARELREMGFGMVITNAYITWKRAREEASRRGIHALIGFEGAVMTDSGGYQVLEYGDVDVGPAEMAAFEAEIGSDIAVPLDRPTGLGITRAEAARRVRYTLRISREALAGAAGGQIWAGPVQGGRYTDLVTKSARGLSRAGFAMMALGSPVEYMESYDYLSLARMIAAARSSIPWSAPLHLFGAGHPLTIPMAVALGCDTFDSASYMLYARNGRYIARDGTRQIGEMSAFPCSCRVCSSHRPAELARLPETERTAGLAVHNLHAIREEVDATSQAIREGRLWEHVMSRARAHPRLYEAARVLAENPALLAEGTPLFKRRAAFLYDAIDQYRPEVRRYHAMARRFRSRARRMVVIREDRQKPGYASGAYARARAAFGGCQVCQYSPHLGLIPIELSDVYPAAHHESADVPYDPAAFPEFGATWDEFVRRNRITEIIYDRTDAFLEHFASRTRGIRRRDISKKGKTG